MHAHARTRTHSHARAHTHSHTHARTHAHTPQHKQRPAWSAPLHPAPPPGGGCGVGVGLGWGFGAAWGSNYVIVDPEFGSATAAPAKPQWFSQLQQHLRIAKFEHTHQAR